MANKADNNEARQQMSPRSRIGASTAMLRHRDRRLKAAQDLCGKIGADIDLVDIHLWTTGPTGDPEVSNDALMLLCEAQNAISAALEMIE